jgi:diguanylate cyclase (GGDEF)-like protein/PAS domain S-box-containing protein
MNTLDTNRFRSFLWRILTEPHPSIIEQNKRWQARLVSFTTLVIILGELINVIFVGSVNTLMLIPLIFGYFLSRTKYFSITSYIVLFALLGSMVYSLLTDGDFNRYVIFANLAWIALSLLLASLLFSIQETVIISMVHIAVFFGLAWFVPEITLRSVGISIGFVAMFSLLLVATMWQRNWLESARQQEIRLQAAALESSDYAVMIIDKNKKVLWVNPAFHTLTGFDLDDVYTCKLPFIYDDDPDERLSSQIWDTLYKGQTWQGVVTNYRKSGEQYYESMTITPVLSDKGETSHFVAVKYDITDQIEGEERLKFLATHDFLTGLPNRGLLHDRLEQAISRARRNNQVGAVLYVDLDDFKNINDAYSHEDGDRVLMVIAGRMRIPIRETDTVARLSGDEFVILLEDIKDTENVIALAERVLYEISKPIQIRHAQVNITASIGITLFPQDGQDISDLLQNADVAMYYGKAEGKNSYVQFTADMKKDILKRIALGRDMQAALDNAEFRLHYQPLHDLRSGQVCGMEALIRWQHPERGVIGPAEFISLAESNKLIIPIGEWVFANAVSFYQQNAFASSQNLQLAVNLSGRQLRNEQHFQTIASTIASSGIDPSRITLEMTESSIFENMEKTALELERLKSLGVRLAIDDFGTGYSSLSYLEQFPIDIIKIDISFIRRITREDIELPILKGIITIAQDMGMEVIAEGVENEAQLNYLKKQGCFLVQGYYLHPPLDQEELLGVLAVV